MVHASRFVASAIALGIIILLSATSCIFFVLTRNMLQVGLTGGLFLASLLSLLVLVFCFNDDPEYSYVNMGKENREEA
jgi:hypothetical protein